MDPEAQINFDVASRLAEELQAMLKGNVLYQNLDHHLELLRLAVTTVAFDNMSDEIANKAEVMLWVVSCAINNKYRTALAGLTTAGPKFLVERNKLLKRYKNFIKTSQYFYKSYIQQLNARFDGVTNLRRIAHRIHVEPLSLEKRVQSTPEIERAVIQSVHSALLHIGDLSRYRNELRTENKSWEHALGYYSLAGHLVAADGSAYNQMAALASQDKNHLDAVYHLYRSLATIQPHLMAKKNLEREFSTIVKTWEGRAKSAPPSPNLSPAETASTTWLLRLHAKLYQSKEFPNHDEIETEFICQTTTLLKDQSIQQEVLSKIALINIAAEYFALERTKAKPCAANRKSYFSLLRLNVRTFFMLLEVLQPEFRSDEYDDLPGNVQQSEKITPLMQLVLPTLRHYSIWLVAQAETLSGYTFGEANSNENDVDIPLIDNLKIHVRELFRLYASTLCLFCTAFKPKDLHEFSEVKYLLEEDAATIGFKPFTDRSLAPYCDIYYTDEGTVKPHVTDQGIVEAELKAEMMTRIKNFIRDGVVIAYNMQNTPIKIAEDKDGVFYFLEDRLPDIFPTNGHSPGHSMSSLEMKRTLSERDQVRGHALGGTILPDTEFTHDSVDQRMNNMVEDLIDSRDDSYGLNTRDANDLLSSQLAEELLRHSREIQAHPRAGLVPFSDAMLTPSNQPLHAQRRESMTKSGQVVGAHTPDRMTSGGIYGHRNQHPEFSSNIPVQSNNDMPGQASAKKDRRPELPGGMLTSSELDFHMEMYNNPFGSSWRNKSSIFAGTPGINLLQGEVTPKVTPAVTPRPTYGGAGGHYRQSSPLTGAGFESSGPGMYGDSRSYEREMMLQSSFPRLNGSGSQIQMQTPPGGQG